MRKFRSLVHFARLERRERILEQRLVWILGAGRSGTTWLLNMLCSLPGVDGTDEPLIGAHLALPVSAFSQVPDIEDRTVYSVSRARKGYFLSDERRSQWEPALRSLLLAGLHGRATDDINSLLVVKEPKGAKAAPLIMSVLPHARLLFMVRDGRDVVDSGLDGLSGGWVTEAFGAKVETREERLAFLSRAARHWVASNQTVQSAFEAHDPRLRLRISYEELRADTVPVLGRISSWLNREVPLQQLEEIASRLSFEAVPESQRGSGKFVRAARPGLWQEHFDDEERSLLDEIMAPTLSALGYEPMTKRT